MDVSENKYTATLAAAAEDMLQTHPEHSPGTNNNQSREKKEEDWYWKNKRDHDLKVCLEQIT